MSLQESKEFLNIPELTKPKYLTITNVCRILNIPELTKPKHLTITNVCRILREYAWHRSPPLIRASHCLHKLTLKVSVVHAYEKLSFSYQSLKMVEIISFARHKIEFKILFLVEKVVIDRQACILFYQKNIGVRG